MHIETSLSGRLRNTSLPKSYPLLPVFEAVVNGIQAIDGMDHPETGRVTVRVRRSGQGDLFRESEDSASTMLEPIVGFDVTDNGIGFTDENLHSFRMLDSEYKAAQGGRGVGRLLWLKAFSRVEIVSLFSSDSKTFERRINFTAQSGVEAEDPREVPADETGSTVRLIAYKRDLQGRAPKTIAAIARAILEHCLWYFVRAGGAPSIVIADDSDSVSLDAIYDDYMESSTEQESFQVSGYTFSLLHLRLKPTAKSIPTLNWCAANRVVDRESLSGKIPGLHGRLHGPAGDYAYSCFLFSEYLDDNVRAERTSFDIEESNEGTLISNEPSLGEIRDATIKLISDRLEPALQQARQAGRDRVESFVNNRSPRYRPILSHIEESKLGVDPEISDRDLELELHKHLANLESELLIEGQQVLNPTNIAEADYEARRLKYLSKVEDVKKSDLAGYVSSRRVVLDLLERAIEQDENGHYVREEDIHSLIMPMRVTSNDVSPDSSNLWILDEGLAFHNYLASDVPIRSMPVTGSESGKEPDLLSLSLVDSPILVSENRSPSLASITVVEFKRPMRNDAAEGEGKDPIEQALTYLRRVREGTVRTYQGRPIPRSEDIPGFVYVIADLTPRMATRCDLFGLKLTQDGMGYFGYNDPYKAYIEVSNFDRLLKSATQRNRAFFDRLGFPAS